MSRSLSSSGVVLIRCPECEKKVSDRANACPSCGFPVARGGARNAAPAEAEEPRPEGDRGTGFWDYISPILFLGGGLGAIFMFQRGDTKHGVFGVLLCLAGAIGTVRLFMGRPYHGRRRR